MEIYGILIVLILVFLFAGIVSFTTKEKEDIVVCKGKHSWITDQYEKLVCMECGFRPESHQ